jgi:hypothetical protein
MARFFESKQTFAQRLVELGLTELEPKFLEKGWTSFSVLAFATDYVPGTSAPALFLEEVVKPLVGEDQPAIDKWKPLLKRLFVEAYTMAAHDVQTRTEGADPDEPRRMPNAEREYRLQVLQDKLPGLRLEGELQPSFHLIDLCSSMFETGQVTYIPWEKCTKRDAEASGVKIEQGEDREDLEAGQRGAHPRNHDVYPAPRRRGHRLTTQVRAPTARPRLGNRQRVRLQRPRVVGADPPGLAPAAPAPRLRQDVHESAEVGR